MTIPPIFKVTDNWEKQRWFAGYGYQMKLRELPSLKEVLITDGNHNFLTISAHTRGWKVVWNINISYDATEGKHNSAVDVTREYVMGQRFYSTDTLLRAFALHKHKLTRAERKLLPYFPYLSDGIPGYFIRLGRQLNLPEQGVSIFLEDKISLAIQRLIQ